MLQPLSHHVMPALMVSPERTQDKNIILLSIYQTAVTLSPWCTLIKCRTRKHKILAAGSSGAYERSDFNEPRLLHLPIF